MYTPDAGSNGKTGNITILTGESSDGDSGSTYVSTGHATEGRSGDIILQASRAGRRERRRINL